jgi:hypothetical protein
MNKKVIIYGLFVVISMILLYKYKERESYIDIENIVGCYYYKDLPANFRVKSNSIEVDGKEILYYLDNDNLGTALRTEENIGFHQGFVVGSSAPLAIRVHDGKEVSLGIWDLTSQTEIIFTKVECQPSLLGV